LERIAVSLCNELARRGTPVHLGTWGHQSQDFYDPLVDSEVRRVRFARPRRRGSGTFPARVLRRVLGIWDLARYLRRHDIAIVHAHNESTLRLAVAAGRVVPATAIVWHHHDGNHRQQVDPPVRRAARRADRVIVVTADLVGWARDELGIDPSIVTRLSSFVAPQHHDPQPPSSEQPGVDRLPGAPERRIVCVANLRRSKDHATILRAMVDVAAAVPDAHLLLVGGASEDDVGPCVRSAIDRMGLRDHVSMLGRRPDVGSILRASAVGILGSSYEGSPVVLLEYGVAGLPVVATAVGECPEILDFGRAGTLVPPADPTALGAAVARYLRDPALRGSSGAALRARVRARYTPDAALSVVEAVYGELVPGVADGI